MGQAERGLPEAAALSEDASIGAYLARERRLRGIGLDELARLTRLPRRSLERLETGAFDAHPDGFARGFVRTVAEALGLDPLQTVARMLAEPGEDARRPAIPGRVARATWVWLGVAALLLSGLGLWVSASRVAGSRPDASPVSELVHRRDAVRELAESAEPLPERPVGPEASLPR